MLRSGLPMLRGGGGLISPGVSTPPRCSTLGGCGFRSSAGSSPEPKASAKSDRSGHAIPCDRRPPAGLGGTNHDGFGSSAGDVPKDTQQTPVWACRHRPNAKSSSRGSQRCIRVLARPLRVQPQLLTHFHKSNNGDARLFFNYMPLRDHSVYHSGCVHARACPCRMWGVEPHNRGCSMRS